MEFFVPLPLEFSLTLRRLKVMEMLPDEGNAEKILYLIFYDLNERLSKRKLPGFEYVFSEPFHPLAQEVRL